MGDLGLDSRHFVGLGSILGIERTERGLLLCLAEERLRIEVIRADVVRLKLAQATGFDETPTFAASFAMPPPVAYEVIEDEASVTLVTTRLRLVLGKRDAALDVYRSDGSKVCESARDEAGRSRGFLRQNDGFLLTRRLGRHDAIYGLGERTGPFDRRGRRYVSWNVDVLSPGVLRRNRLHEANLELTGKSTEFDPYYSTVPFFYHARPEGERAPCAGFFIDNAHKGLFAFDSDDHFSVRFDGGGYTEYVFAGPEMRDVLEAYTFITGRPQLPPLWSLGHHQCRWHDYSADALLEVGRRYRASGIPCDALWLDIGYMEGYRVFSWSRERFPEPAATLARVSELGFRAVTIVDPGIKFEPGYEVFDAARAGDLLCKTPGGAIFSGEVWPGRTAFPDFSKAEARAFWAERIRRHAELGVDGIWNDMNEPATGEVEPFAMWFSPEGTPVPHERFHNQYGLLMALATAEGLLAARPDERPFILSRAGFAGIQRVAAQWLGDNYSDWDHLAMGIAMALGMGVSGQPFIGADIPGFVDNANPELAARWFEYGALTPFCRCHNAMHNRDHYPWSFGAGVEQVARASLLLRYRLLPYLYTAFSRAAETGEPVQRPLAFDFQHDLGAREVMTQFMLGPGLLVAPVVRAGQTARHVYLPPGSWTDWHTGTRLEGGRFALMNAALGSIPLLARGGAVIPTFETAPQTTSVRPELIELHAFVPTLDGETTSFLYEDDGLGFSYREGAYFKTDLTLRRRGNRLVLTGAVTGRGFAESRRRRLALHIHGPNVAEASLDGRSAKLTAGSLTFENSGQGFAFAARLET